MHTQSDTSIQPLSTEHLEQTYELTPARECGSLPSKQSNFPFPEHLLIAGLIVLTALPREHFYHFVFVLRGVLLLFSQQTFFFAGAWWNMVVCFFKRSESLFGKKAN